MPAAHAIALAAAFVVFLFALAMFLIATFIGPMDQVVAGQKRTVVSLMVRLLRNTFIAGMLLAAAFILMLAVAFRDQEIARFQLPNQRTITLHAEGAFFYEPPGYIYVTLVDHGSPLLKRRRFRGVGPERIPPGQFAALGTADGEIVALTYGCDVEMMYEFAEKSAWPGEYTRVDWPEFELGQRLFRRLEAEHKSLTCSRLKDFVQRSVPSPDGRLLITNVWLFVPSGKKYGIRITCPSGHQLYWIEADHEPVNENLNVNPWTAGWIDDETIGVWTKESGFRAWKLLGDGAVEQLPSPLPSDFQDRIKSLPCPGMMLYRL